MKRKLLWIGDHCCSTGFARASHETLAILKRYWDISVIGMNYWGDPHPFPYPIYPAFRNGDAWGVKKLEQLRDIIRPDVIVVQNDPWNVLAYIEKAGSIPVVATMPVDGKNCRGNELNKLTHAIFWTEFGLNEARAGGYTGPASIVPLGVNLDTFKVLDKTEARRKVGLPDHTIEAFIAGNVNRNQQRKRLDLTIKFFCEWAKDYKIDDAYLFLYCAQTETGWDLRQLMRYYDLPGRLILVEPDNLMGFTEESLVQVYNCFDVQLTTTQGEGWGLPTLEGMACGVPQIVPNWAALGEWCTQGSIRVPCSATSATPNRVNAIGAVPDQKEFTIALDTLYHLPRARQNLAYGATMLASKSCFRWHEIGEAFHQDILNVLDGKVACSVVA